MDNLNESQAFELISVMFWKLKQDGRRSWDLFKWLSVVSVSILLLWQAVYAPYSSVSLAFEATGIANVSAEAQCYTYTYRISVTNLRVCSTALTSCVKWPAC